MSRLIEKLLANEALLDNFIKLLGVLIAFAITWLQWKKRQLEEKEALRKRAEDAVDAGVEAVWQRLAKPAKAAGVKLSETQREQFRNAAVEYAESILGQPLLDIFGSLEAVHAKIQKSIAARRSAASSLKAIPVTFVPDSNLRSENVSI
mgnify:FL=1